MYQSARKLTLTFPKSVQGPLKLANDLVESLKNFQVHMPLVKVFSNTGLKDRHWEEISALVGYPAKPDRDLTLSRVIDLESVKHLVKLEEISDVASKEFNIEKIMNKM